MAMGSFNPGGQQAPMAEINTTPLVDVMLVLLIIFIITAPLMTHSIKLDLPQAASTPHTPLPKPLHVSIDAENRVYLGTQPSGPAQLEAAFRNAVAADPQTELHLYADQASRYASVAETLSAARRAGLSKIGFVTQPGQTP